MKRGYIFGVILVVLLISLVSAGFFDFLNPKQKGPTGRAAFGEQNVSVQVEGIYAPIVSYVQELPSTLPIEFTTRTVVFEVHVYDEDGVGNLDPSMVFANFTRTGETDRFGTCSFVNNIDANTANFTCSIDMWYYDGDGAWNIAVNATDDDGRVGVNNTMLFNYGLLQAMEIYLTQVTWPSVAPGALNQTSNNDPTIVNNTGNYNDWIRIDAYDLQGAVTPTEYIYAGNFSVGETTGAQEECDVGVTAVALGPGDGQRVTTTINSNPGLPGFNTANIYYCITEVPSVSSQTYSTSTRGPAYQWKITYES